jgi:integrase
MTIRKASRRGETRLVVDITYTRRDGTKGRYRHDAEVQTMAAARAEERRVLASIAIHGEPSSEIVAGDRSPNSEIVAGDRIGDRSPVGAVTFAEVVEVFRAGKAKTKLKPSTRVGYEEMLTKRLLPRFGAQDVQTITFTEVMSLDASMVEEGLSPARRRNVLIVLRSVLGAAVDAGKLSELPKLPKLPRVGRKVLRCLVAEQVQRILDVSCLSWKVAFGLAAYAGLRAGEVRGLQWADVDLERGTIIVRWSLSRGFLSTPKSGHERKIPITEALRRILEEAKPRAKGHVSTTVHAQVWSEFGLLQVFERACKRAEVGRWRFHDLRHYFVTSAFGRGGSAPAIQALAGHASLVTTERYAHVAEQDLRRAVGL